MSLIRRRVIVGSLGKYTEFVEVHLREPKSIINYLRYRARRRNDKMGVMNKMRDNMAGIMIFLVIVFVLTMSVGGLVGGADITDLIGGGQPNAFTVVNGEELTRENFMRSLQNERDGFRQQNGVEPNEQQMLQLTDQVWETMVTQILIRQELEARDIDVSTERSNTISPRIFTHLYVSISCLKRDNLTRLPIRKQSTLLKLPIFLQRCSSKLPPSSP